MSQENQNLVGFQRKFVTSWLIVGAVFAVPLGIALFTSPDTDLTTFEIIMTILFTPVAMVIIGFGCLLFDRAFGRGRESGEVTHRKWVWHIYPIFILGLLLFSLTLGFVFGWFNKK